MTKEKGHYQVNNLPEGISECWFYTGKHSSIHIVMKPVHTEIFVNGKAHHIEVSVPQINIDLPRIRKSKD